MNIFFYLWLIIALLCIILEMGYPGLFFFLSFALGALITAGSTFFYDSIIIQCVLFLLGSIISLIVLIKWVKRSGREELPYQHTNTQALIGQLALVVKDIGSTSSGEVKIGGELWMARGVCSQTITAGTQVMVVYVRGAHVVVKPLV